MPDFVQFIRFVRTDFVYVFRTFDFEFFFFGWSFNRILVFVFFVYSEYVCVFVRVDVTVQ